jgi:hypothetical protein
MSKKIQIQLFNRHKPMKFTLYNGIAEPDDILGLSEWGGVESSIQIYLNYECLHALVREDLTPAERSVGEHISLSDS